MKHNPMATANASAATIGITYIVCRLLIGLFPKFMSSIAQSWFHSFAVNSPNSEYGNFVLGLITAVFTAWVIGYIFAISYNSFARK